MQINYANASGFYRCFYQYILATRHFQITIAPSASIKTLVDRNVLELSSISMITLLERVKHLVLFALEMIPGIGLVIALADAFFNNKAFLPSELNPAIRKVIQTTDIFSGYSVGSNPRAKLLDLSMRPANFFYRELGGFADTTQPGSGSLFKFLYPISLSDDIFQQPDNQTVSITALGKKGHLFKEKVDQGEVNLEDYFGKEIYEMSFGEIKEVINSQKVFVSPLLPKPFYLRLKDALKADGYVTLPGMDAKAVTVSDLLYQRGGSELNKLLRDVNINEQDYGFKDDGSTFTFDQIQPLTLYQLGAMVVKAEDYHCFIGDGYKIANRKVGEKDQIRLISACGIRGFHHTHKIGGNERHQIDYRILKHTFSTAMQAAGDGAHFIMPAFGMGVWGGDPDTYWRAFLDAVIESKTQLDTIFINPGHQKTKVGKYRNYGGEEFEKIFSEYSKNFPNNVNLKKVINLFNHKTDLLLLAKNLKKRFPSQTVALVNASDPDVTLGNHVGEYVNNLCHEPTTEENFTAVGTNGLNFEQITEVLADDARVIQAG